MTHILYVRPKVCTCIPTSYEEEQAAFAKMKAELQVETPNVWQRLWRRFAGKRRPATSAGVASEKTA